MQNIFTDQKDIKLEINSNKISRKSPSMLQFSNTTLNNPWIKQGIRKKIERCFTLSDNENTTSSKYVGGS